LLHEIGQHISHAVQATWVVFLERTPGNDNTLRLRVLAGSGEKLSQQLQETLVTCSRQALSKATPQLLAVGKDSIRCVAAVPLGASSEAPVLLAAFDHQTNGETVMPVLELAAVHVALWSAKHELADCETETRSVATLAELMGRLASSGDLGLACYTLVDELQRFLDCRQVVLGLTRDGKTCRVVSVSGTSVVDRRSDRVCSFEAALDETVVRGQLTLWPPNDAGNRHSIMAHKNLADSVAAAVVSSPIRDDSGDLLGAWLFLGDETPLQDAETIRFIEAAAPLVGSSLAMLKRAERSALQKSISKVAESFGRWSGRMALVAIGLIVALMFVPFPYKVKCDCELQPVVRRYVAAPFDATLEKSYVEPGDLVCEGQPLAQIDGREIRWEIAGLAADRTRAAKERDGHLATHDFGAAEVAKHEVERLDIRAELLEHRGDHLELRSPIDGIVITGDLKKAEGVPLTVGQTLFEVAPLDSMIVEIAIPEEDIRHVSTEQLLEVVLDAFPNQRFNSNLVRIHPRSEVKETEHAFIGEVCLDNPDERLRPGMQGTATITTTRHALGWNLFHKPWEKMMYWLGW